MVNIMETELVQIDTDWIEDLNYYNLNMVPIEKIKFNFFYVKDETLISKKEKRFKLKTDNFVSKESIIKVIQENKFINNEHFYFLRMNYFNITQSLEEIKLSLDSKIELPLIGVKIVDDIHFNPGLDILSDLNEINIFFIKKNSSSKTKRIIINKQAKTKKNLSKYR